MQFATKKQRDRYASLMQDGQPKKIRCYDNGGETADRYTCVFTGSYRKHTGGEFWHLGMSGNPFHPQGIGQHGHDGQQIDRPTYSHLGKKVKFADLPKDVQKCITQTYLYIWGFTDDDGKSVK